MPCFSQCFIQRLAAWSEQNQSSRAGSSSDLGDRSETPSAPDLMPSPTIILSLLTGPTLLVFLGGKLVQQALKEIGQVSEELLRGDRLPTLTVPEGLTETSETSSEPIDPPE